MMIHNMRFRNFLFTCAIALSTFITSFSQSTPTPPKDWFLRDPETDHLQGVSAEKAYQSLLKGQPSRTIIVAVIDGGVDVEHEDLKRVIWVNEKEIAGNGIDDDKNGYVDDIHGWNFLGGKNGNVNEDTYELTREYIRLNKIFGDPNFKPAKKQKAEFENYKNIKTKFIALRDKNKEQYDTYRTMYANLKMSIDTLKALMKVDKLTKAKIDSFNVSNDPTLAFAKGFTLTMLRRSDPDDDLDKIAAEIKEGVDYFKVIVEYGYNVDFNSRLIIGDNYSDVNERIYGNNDVKGPDAEHGTHVAGIIGADRQNGIGINGIADNVRIMAVRAVPNGDERDKDVANAIRYAVDNGANIINMSFGKGFSPEKQAVDDAVRYAEKKGVLLIHAAGNESANNDKDGNFPSRYLLDGKEAKNWLEVGASSWNNDEHIVASFSNYGKKSVDLFAPGEEIYSTTPENTYKDESGTSMASPVSAGVAALLMSYFPDLTPLQILDILKKSTRKLDGLKVDRPGDMNKVSFDNLSNTGGLINVYEAVKMAQAVKGTKVEK